MSGFPRIGGLLVGDPKNKDCGILGSILGTYSGKLACFDSMSTFYGIIFVVIIVVDVPVIVGAAAAAATAAVEGARLLDIGSVHAMHCAQVKCIGLEGVWVTSL